jgi:hypothetical protein
MEHLINIAVMALVPLGIWVAMGEGMVLEWLHKWWTRPRKLSEAEEHIRHMEGDESPLPSRFPPWIQKPLATCARCMVTGWGVPAVLLLNAGDVSILALLAYIPAAVGLQELIDR